jgi:hypothetical protein
VNGRGRNPNFSCKGSWGKLLFGKILIQCHAAIDATQQPFRQVLTQLGLALPCLRCHNARWTRRPSERRDKAKA